MYVARQGDYISVCGQLKWYREELQLRVEMAWTEHDPNAEALWHVEVVERTQRWYRDAAAPAAAAGGDSAWACGLGGERFGDTFAGQIMRARLIDEIREGVSGKLRIWSLGDRGALNYRANDLGQRPAKGTEKTFVQDWDHF